VSPTFWTAVSAGVAVGPNGFQASDVGRLMRLYSEPPLWAVGTAYVAKDKVAYNTSGVAGATTYWTCLVGNTGNIPGNDLINWAPTPANAVIWSWGKITGLSTQIAQNLAGSVNIGTMTGGGGLAAAFDGSTAQAFASCASLSTGNLPGFVLALDGYVGKNYTAAAAQAVQSAIVFPSSDKGFAYNLQTDNSSGNFVAPIDSIVLKLRGKATAPASASDGTVLATSANVVAAGIAPVTLTSSDQATTWNFVWVEILVSTSVNAIGPGFNHSNLTASAAEVRFYNAPGTGSTTGVTLQLLGPPLLYTTAIRTWRMGVYSNTTGWPTCGCHHEGRLWLSGAVANRFDGSYSNGLSGTTVNFAPTDQNGIVSAANAISYTVNADSVNPIFWMVPDEQGIIMGTLGGEIFAVPPTAGAMSPFNIAARRRTKIGAANVEPRRTDHTLVFVQRYARKLMEYFADVYSGKFSAPNLAERAMHISKPGIAELAYTQGVLPAIWGRKTDGSLFGITYKRDTLSTAAPPVAGWHRHTLGSNRTIESICAGPSLDGTLDSLTMVTNDTATGFRHVEIMTDAADEGATLAQAAYLDNAINPSSTTSSLTTPSPYGGLTLNGLWHLNGKTVTAWLAGLDCGDFTVSNGSITVPYGDGVSGGTATGLFTADLAAATPTSQMLVGFTFTSDGQLVRPATKEESGARQGPALGKKRRSHGFAVQLEGTQGISFGTTFSKMDPAQLRFEHDVPYPLTRTFTGVFQDALTDDHSYDSMFCWRLTRPYPCNIVAVQAFIHTMDR
jgi:hypothetical protein